MSEKQNPIASFLDDLMSDPLKLAGATIVLSLGIGFAALHFPYESMPAYGSRHLTMEKAIVVKGQEVYYQEGCQYCHSQNLRSLNWEVARFAQSGAEQPYGYFPLPEMMEYNFEMPSLRGSSRLGPDLSRVAGRFDEAQLTSLLKSTKTDSLRSGHHRYGHLFQSDAGINPLFLSWRIRMMMEWRAPLSDDFQKSAFEQLNDKSRGDALVAYLLSLGKKQSDFAGKFYNNQ